MSALRLHHVQVGCPRGGEEPARRFWVDGLGLTEVDKPAPLRGRGGAWFVARDDAGAVLAEVHVGVEEPCAPPRRAHLALHVGDVARLEALIADLRAPVLVELGVEVDTREADTFPGYRRVHVRDPHQNRVELLASPDLGI